MSQNSQKHGHYRVICPNYGPPHPDCDPGTIQPPTPGYTVLVWNPDTDRSRSQQPRAGTRGDILIDLRTAKRVNESFDNVCIAPGCNEVIHALRADALISHIRARHPHTVHCMGPGDWVAVCLRPSCGERLHAETDSGVLQMLDGHVQRRHWRLWTRVCPVLDCQNKLVDGGRAGMGQHISGVHKCRFTHYHDLDDYGPDRTDGRQ